MAFSGIVFEYMADRVVTRFAPSPTGYLHAGNYRTAIFAYLYAKKMGGQFLVRIEDTDKERSKKEYEDNILETLKWLTFTPDTLYRQSEHEERHRQELKRLIDSGYAYVSQEVGGDRKEVIRFKNPNQPLTFTDVIRGEITFDTTELGDFIIARSETEPLFHCAVVVDDADEGVTHVIRGEDHISNTPRQILIGRALGYTTSTYVHLPLVLGPDRAKLSKRRGAKALTEYRDEGFLPEAMLNYLALLGWHPEGDREIFTLDELVAAFDLARIQKGAGTFDEVKLRWVNHEHIKRLSDEAFIKTLSAFAGREVDSRLAPLLKERAQTLKEAEEALGEMDFLEGASPTAELLLKGARVGVGEAKKHLTEASKLLSALPESPTAEEVKGAIFPYASEVGRAGVLWPLRVALSGREKSPDPFTLVALLGKAEALTRIEDALKLL